MIYYISDLHFRDERVFGLTRRPFKNVEEFEKYIISTWNLFIKSDDVVYILGDIADDNHPESIEIIKELNGQKHLIIGNHDLKNLKHYEKSNVFKSINHNLLIEDNGRKVFLCHYPVMDRMEFNRGGYHVYGHIHNKDLPDIKKYYKDKLAYNVSCDVIDFRPRTLDELIKLKEENIDEPYIN